MRKIVHVRTGEQGTGAEIDDWIRRQHAIAEVFDDALDACLHVALRRDQPPVLVWVGAARLPPQEGELLHYISLGWPGCPAVLYGTPQAGVSGPPGVLHVCTPDGLRALLELSLDALLARLRSLVPPPRGCSASQVESNQRSILEPGRSDLWKLAGLTSEEVEALLADSAA